MCIALFHIIVRMLRVVFSPQSNHSRFHSEADYGPDSDWNPITLWQQTAKQNGQNAPVCPKMLEHEHELRCYWFRPCGQALFIATGNVRILLPCLADIQLISKISPWSQTTVSYVSWTSLVFLEPHVILKQEALLAAAQPLLFHW